MTKIPPKLLPWLAVVITLILFMFSKSEYLLASIRYEPFISLAQISALTGITLLCSTFIMSSRHQILDRYFGGLDKLYRVHHDTGRIAYYFLLAHPLFLVTAGWSGWDTFLYYFLPNGLLTYTLGMLALYTLTILLTITLYIKLRYHVWKSTHEYMGIALLLGGSHAMFIGSDISRFPPLRIWILLLLILALISVIYRRFLYSSFGPVFSYTLISIKTDRIVTELILKPVSNRMNHKAGQFLFVSFPEYKNLRELHPFSISSSPKAKELRLSIKNSGDYTSDIASLKLGSTARVWGPYGKFLSQLPITSPALFIAGGIGITPFLSLLQENKMPSLTLIYTVGDISEAYAHRDLVSLSGRIGFSYHLHQSKTKGHLTIEKLQKYVPRLNQHQVFLCGPAKMMHSLRSQLILAGIPDNQIFFEDFSLK